MKFSWGWIQELSGTALTPQQAADLLSAKAFEVESVEGDVFDINVLPNRSDCLSHLGIARELCALEGRRFAAPQYEFHIGQHPAASISVQDTEGCPRFSALVIKDIHVGPSPAWLRERLETCGLRSINAVVDVTNYVMLELGQPMHAFDLRHAGSLVIRRARAGETLHALDEARTEYALDPSMMVVADAQKPLAIAGIKGGADSGITDATTGVLLEAAHWTSQDVRATSKKLDLRTDASIRFSYGTDPNITTAALVRAGQLLQKMGAGTPDGAIIDAYPVSRIAHTIRLETDYARALLGVAIGDAAMRGILESLGFDVAEDGDALRVTVPTRRADVQGLEDIIEEIGRLYGYDAIPSAPPVLPVYDTRAWVAEEDTDTVWDEQAYIRERAALGHLLAGAGYSETYNYVFLSDELKALGRQGPTLDAEKGQTLFELARPQSGDYRWLRRSLVPRLLVQARENLRYFDQVRLFETGHVFDHVDQGPESARVGLVLAKRSDGAEPDVFYELKGAVDLVLQELGVADYFYDDAPPMTWDESATNALAPGARALIRLEGNQQVIGCIGTVASRMSQALKLKGVAAVAELDLRALIHHAQQEREFEPLPKYPSVVRDIAVRVDVDTKIGDILQTVQDADTGGLVRDVDVFDIFEPTGTEKLKAEGDTPEYGKSVAFHVVFRAADRTLRDDEVAKLEDAIKRALQEKLNAHVR